MTAEKKIDAKDNLKENGPVKKEQRTADDEFKNAENTRDRIKILVNKIKKLNAVQADSGSRSHRKNW